jgi:hypothetical protein
MAAMPPGADPEDEAAVDAAIASLPAAERAELDALTARLWPDDDSDSYRAN